MGIPVVVIAAGGLPVADNTASGIGVPMTVAANGYGTPVTVVVGGAAGIPVVFVPPLEGGGGEGDGFFGSAMLGGGLFPVVITGNGSRQANLGGVMVDTSED